MCHLGAIQIRLVGREDGIRAPHHADAQHGAANKAIDGKNLSIVHHHADEARDGQVQRDGGDGEDHESISSPDLVGQSGPS